MSRCEVVSWLDPDAAGLTERSRLSSTSRATSRASGASSASLPSSAATSAAAAGCDSISRCVLRLGGETGGEGVVIVMGSLRKCEMVNGGCSLCDATSTG